VAPIESRLSSVSVQKSTFEPVFTFSETNRPTCLGACLGMPRDESYAIYRRVTRTVTTLTVIENFH
jgi:hypothetical protein